MVKFSHLHNHDQYSYLDGYGSAEQYAEEAERLGFEALALTNHGNVDGAVKFQKACKDKGIQPIIGCELYIVNNVLVKGKEKRYHLTALVKNQTGWESLLRLNTKANLKGFYRVPRVDPEMLMEHTEGLIFMSACTSSFLLMDNAEKILLDLKEAVGSDLYLEIMPHAMKDQIKVNKLAHKMSQKHRVRLVATNDCHYPNRQGAKSQEVLLAIQQKAKWNDPDRWKFDINSLYLKTYEEMVKAFKSQNSLQAKVYIPALERTEGIVDKCKGFEIKQLEVILPKVPGYEDWDDTELLRELSEKGFIERIKKRRANVRLIKEYRERLDEEFGLICELGFQRYFLIVWELIKWCKENDIMTGPGRGSVGGSLLAYFLYITDVDPIRYGLIFSRFISPARIDLPDIDMDFEDIKRERIREHLEDCYGKHNVSGLTTFMTLKGRGAVRDVSRVFDVPYSDVDAAAKSIVVRSGGDFRSDFTIEDAFDTFEDGIRFKKKYPEVARLSMELEGQVRGVGQHAAAMCISSDDLRDGKRCNLSIRKNTILANWDKYDSEFMGLMKLDILGLSALTVLNETRRLIRKNHGDEIVFDDIPLDDKEVYKEISRGHTTGAFQIGSIGLSQYCRELGIHEFEDIVHATALWRPGTLRSGMAHEFRLRKNKKVEWKHIHPSMSELTDETYGVILYQEQVMRFMYEFAGLPWKTCDTVRKVISKSQGDELFQQFKGLFVEGCKERKTLDPKAAEKVWDELSTFGSYGFNKAHSVEYSLITYWDMWMKVHYPAEFMAMTLTYGSGDKKAEYAEECRRLGLKIELPKVGISHPSEWVAIKGDNRLFIPFSEIKGIGEKTAEQILNIESDGDGFIRKDDGIRKPNKTVIENLKRIKAFDPDAKLTDDEMEELIPLFQFDLFDDPMRKIRRIYEMISESLEIKRIADINFDKTSKKPYWLFGNMTELRFGYKSAVLKSQKGKGETSRKQQGESMGGVYGFLKDESGATMVIFKSNLYQERKEIIEHCEGQWMLTKVSNPKKTQNVFCEDVIFDTDLLICDIPAKARINLVKEINPKLFNSTRKEIADCKYCNLREECRQPVPPSPGKFNIGAFGEAPGYNEDKRGKGFLGKAGKVLWELFSKYGITREMLYVSDIVKCYPSKTKTPTKKHIAACSEMWLEHELELLKPKIILAMGNTGLKYFKGRDSGITDLNNTCEWSNKFNCWIFWSIHPASALYSPENKETLRESIEGFSRRIKSIGA